MIMSHIISFIKNILSFVNYYLCRKCHTARIIELIINRFGEIQCKRFACHKRVWREFNGTYLHV